MTKICRKIYLHYNTEICVSYLHFSHTKRKFNLLRVLCLCSSLSEHYVAFLFSVFLYLHVFELQIRYAYSAEHIPHKNMVNAECHINTITEHTVGFMSLFQHTRYRCNAWALHHLNLYSLPPCFRGF